MAAAALSAAAVSTSAAAIQRLSSDGDAKTYEGLPQIKIPPSAAADAAAAIAIAIAGSSYLGAATAARLLLATYCKGSRLAGECIPQQGRQAAAIDDPCGAHLSKPWPVAAVVRFPAAERGLQYEGDLLLCGFAARHALLRELRLAATECRRLGAAGDDQSRRAVKIRSKDCNPHQGVPQAVRYEAIVARAARRVECTARMDWYADTDVLLGDPNAEITRLLADDELLVPMEFFHIH